MVYLSGCKSLESNVYSACSSTRHKQWNTEKVLNGSGSGKSFRNSERREPISLEELTAVTLDDVLAIPDRIPSNEEHCPAELTLKPNEMRMLTKVPQN